MDFYKRPGPEEENARRVLKETEADSPAAISDRLNAHATLLEFWKSPGRDQFHNISEDQHAAMIDICRALARIV